jgi:excisionase family DNA binding protein
MSTLIRPTAVRLGLRVLACLLFALPAAARGEAPRQTERAVLTLVEAAELLRIDPEELQRLAERQELPARRVGTVWRFNRTTLLQWLNGDFETVGGIPGRVQRLTGAELQDVVAGGPALQTQSDEGPKASPRDSDKPIGEAPEERTAEDVFLRGRRVLLGRGDVVVDFGQFYARGDDLQLATGSQGFGLATVRQEALTSLLLARVGVFNETELFAGTTFNTQRSRLLFRNEKLTSASQSDLGNVTVGVNRTLLHERGGRPDVIANFAVHVPTHDNGYAVTGGVAMVKSVDPAVLFANVSYTEAIGRRSANLILLDPGATVGASVGYGLALNDTMAVSTTFSGLFTGSTVLDGSSQRGSQFFSGRFALTSRLAGRLYIEPSVSFGISGPSDSVAFGVTVPYSF